MAGTGEGQYLLDLGGYPSCQTATAGLSKNCATDLHISEVTLDGRDRAWGGVSVTAAVDVNVGPQVSTGAAQIGANRYHIVRRIITYIVRA